MFLKSAKTWIDRYLQSYLDTQPSAGLSFALTDRHKILHIGTYGYANLDAHTPVSPDHLFQIGSISKSFTAIALLQLVEENRLDLDASITDILPWLVIPSIYEPIRIHHLLTHTAGIIRGTEASPTALGEARALRHSPASAPPGEYFHYSNSGYKLLGLILETLEGMPYPEIIRQRILAPLAMSATEPVITDRIRPRQAVAYEPYPGDELHPVPFQDKSALVPSTWVETRTADGSIASTPEDMARYLRALLNRAEGLLPQESFARLIAPAIKGDKDLEEYYAFGLAVERSGERISHGGGMVGFRCELACNLASGMGLIVMMNGMGEPEKAARVILEMASKAGAGEWPDVLPNMDPPFQIGKAERLAGRYRSAKRPLTLKQEGGGLLAVEYGANLVQREQGELQVVHPDFRRYPLVVLEGVDGKVNGLAYGPELFSQSGEKLEESVLPAAWRPFVGRYLSYNPWYRSFEVFARLGSLIYYTPEGGEQPLVEVDPGNFRIGQDARSPEWLQFDVILDGQAQLAVFSGAAFYRVG